MEIIAQIIGILLIVSIVAITCYQLLYREPPIPGYLEWNMITDFEPDTRTNEERLAESRRLIDFELARYQTGDKEG